MITRHLDFGKIAQNLLNQSKSVLSATSTSKQCIQEVQHHVWKSHVFVLMGALTHRHNCQ